MLNGMKVRWSNDSAEDKLVVWITANMSYLPILYLLCSLRCKK